MATTTNYGWTKPTVGADTGTWGTELNTDLDGIDSTVFTVSGVANAAMPKAGGTFTGPPLLANGSQAAPGLAFASDSASGFYWIGTHHFGLSVNNTAVADFTATTFNVAVALTVAGAATVTGTLTSNGLLQTAATALGGAGLNVPHGTAPTTPSNGDVWTTTAGMYARINGATVGPFGASGVGSFNTRTGAVTLTSGDVTTALGFTPYNAASAGTAAAQNTGTSGANVPLLNGNLTYSGNNTHNGTETFANVMTAQAGLDITTPLTTPTTTEAGYMGVPQNSQAGSYGIVAADRGKEIYLTATGTVTIPANGSVAFPIGTTIEISAAVGATVTVAITTDTLRWVPSNTTGSRTLAGPGSAVIQKKTATEWWIKGDVS